MNWPSRNVKKGKLERQLRSKKKRKSTRRKRQSLRKSRGRREKRNGRLRKGLNVRERREAITAVRIEVETGVVPGGLEVVEVGRRKKDPEVEVLGGEEVVAGETGRRTRRTNGDQGEEVEKIAGGMMMVHLPGVAHHHPEEAHLLGEDLHLQGEMLLEVEMVGLGEGGMLHQEALLQDADHHLDVEEAETMDHLEEVLHLEEILEKETEVDPGGLAPQEMILPEVETGIVALLEEVGGTLEKGEVLLLGECLQEEDLLPEGILAEMMTAEEVLLVVHLQKVELGAAEVVTDPLLEEVLHQDAALLPEEDHHLGVEGPLPAEEVVTMAQLTGAVTALLPVTTQPHPNQDQPAKQKTQAGPLSSVSPRPTWDSPGFRDLLRLPGIVAS